MRKKHRYIGGALLVSIGIILLTCIALFISGLLTGEISLNRTRQEALPTPAEMRAFTVYAGQDGDFPTQPNLPVKEQQAQLDEMVAFASTYGFNTIFFEAISEGSALYRSALLPPNTDWMKQQGTFGFFDPLDYLTEVAREKQIQVYALIDPLSVSSQSSSSADSLATKNPLWITSDGFLNPSEPQVQELASSITKELVKGYNIAGIVLHEVSGDRFDSLSDYDQQLVHLFRQMKPLLRDDQRLGAISGAEDAMLFAPSFAESQLDFVIPFGFSDPLEDSDALLAQLKQWELTAGQNGGNYYPLHSVSDETARAHRVDNAGFFERSYSANGVVVSSYHTLHTIDRIAAVSLAASFVQKPVANAPDLTFPQTFAITRPNGEKTRLSSDWSTYYVGGTGSPTSPVLLNGKPLEPSPSGLWGTLVDLEYGENTFSFIQNGVTQTTVIYRAEPSTTNTITDFIKSSLYPATPEMILQGDSLTLACTAPAGGSVTASIGTFSIPLEAPTAQKGTPVTYQATIDVSAFAPTGQVKGLGSVSYELLYDGFKSFGESSGSIYIAGENAIPVAKMNSFGSMINQNSANDGAYLSILRKDCVDIITENAGSYYKLSMGGYVLKSAVDIPEGETSATTSISKIGVQVTDKGEKLLITGDRRPAYIGKLEGTTLTLTIFNTTGWETMNPLALKGELFESIAAEIAEDHTSVVLTITLRDPTLLAGWDVSFEGNEMAVYLRRIPQVDLTFAQPLSNVTVVLDPGHGGNDPGALGIPGLTGPTENILNLFNSYVIRARLEAMGAKVHLVHENTDASLNARLEFSQKMDADFFISSHHNSVALSSDGGSATGVEVYYWNDQSASFAQQIGENISAQTGRKMRGAEQSFYRVTMMTACPAVLVESGFICNPNEYDSIASEFAMLRYGNAVADAVLAHFLPQTAE